MKKVFELDQCVNCGHYADGIGGADDYCCITKYTVDYSRFEEGALFPDWCPLPTSGTHETAPNKPQTAMPSFESVEHMLTLHGGEILAPLPSAWLKVARYVYDYIARHFGCA